MRFVVWLFRVTLPICPNCSEPQQAKEAQVEVIKKSSIKSEVNVGIIIETEQPSPGPQL